MNEIWTIGHSNRHRKPFRLLLEQNGIECLIDVRSYPTSRYVPYFNRDSLASYLNKHGIRYEWVPEVGGRRHGPDSGLNTGWRNKSFRSYADYMQTDDFKSGLKTIRRLGRSMRCCLMCAEAVPWRCHRNLISDALTIRGWRVYEIIDKNQPRTHKLIDFALIEGKRITYPTTEN